MTGPALYLYAIVPTGVRLPGVVGVSEQPLRLLECGRIAALASALPKAAARVSAGNVRAHQQVVEESHLSTTTLPFRFGVVADSEESLVGSFLARHEATLARRLADFEDLTEVRVSARYAGDAALRELVATSARLRRLRESVARRPAAATYYERIALGEEVAGGLAVLRERDADTCSSSLERHARAERRLRHSGEDGAFHAAYLVEQDRVPGFEQGLEQLAAEQRGRLEFELTGPMPLWDFVEMDRKDLKGLPDLATAGRGRGRWAS